MINKNNKKLKLERLKVESFTTEVGEQEKVLGGTNPQLHHLMLQAHNISHYGILFTSNEVFTGKMKLSAIRSNG